MTTANLPLVQPQRIHTSSVLCIKRTNNPAEHSGAMDPEWCMEHTIFELIKKRGEIVGQYKVVRNAPNILARTPSQRSQDRGCGYRCYERGGLLFKLRDAPVDFVFCLFDHGMIDCLARGFVTS